MPPTLNDQLKTILVDAKAFFIDNFRQIVVICLPFIIAFMVARLVLDSLAPSAFNTAILPLFLYLLVYPIYMAGLIKLMVARAHRDQPSSSALILSAVRQWAPLFVLKLLMMVIIGAGILLLIIPGIWLWIRLSFAEFYLVVFNYNPQTAIQKSIAATKRYAMLIFLLLLMTYLPIMAIGLIMSQLMLSLTQSPIIGLLFGILIQFIALFIPVVIFRVFMESINEEQVNSTPSIH